MPTSLHNVLILLTPDQTTTALQIVSNLLSAKHYTATLGTDNSTAIPANLFWLTAVSASALAALCESEGLPQEVTEQFYYALLQGANVLHLKGYITEDDLARLCQDLNGIRSSSNQLQYFYDRFNGPLILDVARTEDTGNVVIGHGSVIQNVVYSPGGYALLTTSVDETAKVWEVATGEVKFTLRGSNGTLTDTNYSLDGSFILATDGSQDVRLWDAQTGQERLRFPGDKASFSPDDKYIAAIEDGMVKVIDIQTGQERLRVSGFAFVYSPDGKRIFISSDTENVIWHIETGQSGPILPTQPLPRWSEEIAYSPDGKNVALALYSSDTPITSIWDVQTGQEYLRIVGFRPIYSPDGRYIITFHRQNNQMQASIWDLQNWQELRQIDHAEKVTFSPRGETFATISAIEDGYKAKIQVWNILAVEPLLTIFSDNSIYDCTTTYSPDGSLILVANRRSISIGDSRDITKPTVIDGTTEVWHISSGRQLFLLRGIHPVYSPDAQQLVTLLDDGRATIWNASTGQFLRLLGHVRILMCVTNRGLGGGPRFLSKDLTDTQLVARFVDVQYPQQVQPGQKFTIYIGLVQQSPSETIEDAQPAKVMVTIDDEGNNTGAPPIAFTLYTTGFSPDVYHGELQVYATKDTPALPFPLEPKSGITGLQPVHVVFYQDHECLGEVVVVIETTPDRAIQQSRLGKKSMTLRQPPEQKWGSISPPDVVLYVTRQVFQGRDRLSYQYEWVNQGWPKQDGGQLDLDNSVEDRAAAYYSMLSKFARPHVPGQLLESDQRELEKLGENLYYELFTPQLKQFYKQFASSSHSLLVYSNEPWIPWEMIKPWGDGLDEQFSDFLSARFQFSRWYTNSNGRRVHPTVDLQTLSAIIPPSKLPYLGEEARYLRGLHERWPSLSVNVLPTYRGQEVLSLIASGTVNLLHFATHGIAPSGTSPAAISLGQGRILVTDLVGTRIEKGLAGSSPLIFINACHSGRQNWGLSKLEGWADRFVTFGCSGFIGANWEIHDKLATDFAINFYEALRANNTVAQAVQKARLALRKNDPANSTWLAYSLYAHPNLRVFALASPDK